jgi:DNA-binding CsgD family transcriptional regulator
MTQKTIYECCECYKELDDNEEAVERYQLDGIRSVPSWICMDCWMGIGLEKTIKQGAIKKITNYKTNSETGCWEWLGTLSESGYGQVCINNVIYPSHRVSYSLFVEDIPKEMYVCHSCDNRKCINPKHLWLGTHQDNMNDMKNKNRSNGKRRNITEKEIEEIKTLYKTGKYTNKQLAKMLNMSIGAVSKYTRGLRNQKNIFHIHSDIYKILT